VKPRREGRVLGALLALCLSGCTTVVVPPARVAEPARVALLDHGRHASLVLKTAESGMVRYAYGDWDWYAQGTTGAIEGSAAVLWPTRAALGRRRLPGPGDWLEQLGCRVQGLVVLSNWEGASGQIARSEARSSDAGRDRPVRQTAIAPAQ
jgi:hypothetical protein